METQIINYQFIFDYLVKSGVVNRSHFVNSNGKHCNYTINIDRMFLYQPVYNRVIDVMVEVADTFFNHECVIGCSRSGFLASMIALKSGSPFIFTSLKQDTSGEFTLFIPSFREYVYSTRILIVSDVINDPKILQNVINNIESHGGIIAGIISIFNLIDWKPESKSIKCKSLINDIRYEYDPNECPMCKENIPLIPSL